MEERREAAELRVKRKGSLWWALFCHLWKICKLSPYIMVDSVITHTRKKKKNQQQRWLAEIPWLGLVWLNLQYTLDSLIPRIHFSAIVVGMSEHTFTHASIQSYCSAACLTFSLAHSFYIPFRLSRLAVRVYYSADSQYSRYIFPVPTHPCTQLDDLQQTFMAVAIITSYSIDKAPPKFNTIQSIFMSFYCIFAFTWTGNGEK